MKDKDKQADKQTRILIQYALAEMWLAPFFIMMALGYVPGYHWSYWRVFFLWNAVMTVLTYFVLGYFYARRRGDKYAEIANDRLDQ